MSGAILFGFLCIWRSENNKRVVNVTPADILEYCYFKVKMPPCLPITLSGDTLGQRHRHLNSLVQETTIAGIPFPTIEVLQEQSTVDRLFKIDLAVKQNNVDYIILTLQDDDMLYVSRALKAKWLLERDIVNPVFLEENLFPNMIKPAVTKFQQWLYINLKNSSACEEFYKYYKDEKFSYAVKFLRHCREDFILDEVPKILVDLTPNILKFLCEICPRVAKLYYDFLESNDDLKERYLKNEDEFFRSIKCVLKSEPEIFLNITEKYYHLDKFERFNINLTDYIMRYHKHRVTAKQELYVSHLLHIPTVAKYLTVSECEDLVVTLARPYYLRNWFKYKAVEPFIKRLAPEKRAALKKKVFIDKNVGDRVECWPYDLPQAPTISSDNEWHVFKDSTFEPIPLSPPMECFSKRVLKKKSAKYASWQCDTVCMESECKTELSRLFDEFRFMGFDRALYELRRRLVATSSVETRRDMLLVLVSKTGGRPESIHVLLELLEKHKHEPRNFRAAITRSLVRRTAAWRLPLIDWERLLAFARELGLDGVEAEAECREGFHAVVIRQLLTGECDRAIGDAFLDKFSTLQEYSLNLKEKGQVVAGLESFLLGRAQVVEPREAVTLLDKYMDVIKAYGRCRIDHTKLVETVKRLVATEAIDDQEDTLLLRSLLQRLYDMRIARRELFALNLKFLKNEESLLNALRHDASAINVDVIIERFSSEKFDRFTKKTVVYFEEENSVADKLRSQIKEKITEKPTVGLARSVVILYGRDVETQIRKIASSGEEYKPFAAALRANVHLARPIPDTLSWGWKFSGVKAIATRLFRARAREIQSRILALASELRTCRIALQLCKSLSTIVPEVYMAVAAKRSSAAIRGALLHFKSNSAASEQVWNVIKPLIENGDFSSKERLRNLIRNTKQIPSNIRPDYCAVIYLSLDKIYNVKTDYVMRYISDLIPHINSDLMEIILMRMLKNPSEQNMPDLIYPALFVRYLLLPKTKNEQEKRMDEIGKPYFDLVTKLRGIESISDRTINFILNQTLESLKYNEVYFNSEYVSSLPVFEQILSWIQTFISREENFEKYVFIHLIMLYFKACRQSVKNSKIFEDPKSKLSEGVDFVGYIYGKYIASEVAVLVTEYFESVLELYATAISSCFSDIFNYGMSRGRLIGKVVEGILAGPKSGRRLAVYVLKEFQHSLAEDKFKNLVETMDKEEGLKLFVHAYLYSDYI